MSMKPLVSVICTVYNKAPWLNQTIDSFLNQRTTFPVEILLIDDASTDDSPSIIKYYADCYPEKIRAIYNSSNLGIARTWVKVCKLAKGQYIARCDGDDFWLDNLKLEKQVKLLAETPQSKWCNTDFDIYDEQGQLISKSGFQSGTIPLADTFEKMLATRGFTMASTWLVDRELMLAVNEMLDLETSDDTFNLQLDLFQRTELSYLDEATVGYVINNGSDSRPKEFSKIEHRFNRLLETQKYYIDKYPTSDYRAMLNILLDRNNQYELILTQKEAGLARIGFETVTIYFERKGRCFSQEESIQYSLSKSSQLTFTVPEDCQRIRVDLSEQPSFYSRVRLVSNQIGTTLVPSFSNGIVLGDAFLFPNDDPQIIYSVPDWYGQEFTLAYQVFEIDDIHSNDYIAKNLGQSLLDLKRKVLDLEQYRVGYHQLESKVKEQKRDLENITDNYNRVISSRRWRIPTKLINLFRRNK